VRPLIGNLHLPTPGPLAAAPLLITRYGATASLLITRYGATASLLITRYGAGWLVGGVGLVTLVGGAVCFLI